MSYQVLARKWRPGRFEDLVGQEHVVRALVNGLDNDRLHHAFLFTGTRGVGKTTIARILAKSLNCEKGVSSRPCGECASCQEVEQGRFVDLIEVDAASRTKVDDTRELLDNVQYAPTRGRYKVYLIDEVHMLSGHSFNALLKTLEEPPPHVKFLLATTDPQKLPVTVLSRCLQFNLKHLQPEQIEGQLNKILTAEGIEFEPAALTLLARSADGSMRDALSLLDQAIAFTAGGVVEASVREMLGTIDETSIRQVLESLATGDAAGLIGAVSDVAERSLDYGAVLEELLIHLYRIAMAQVDAALVESFYDDQRAEALEFAGRISPEDVQLYYQIGLKGRQDMTLAPDPRMGLEMVLLRMLAFRPGAVSMAPVASGGTAQATTSAAKGKHAPVGKTAATAAPAEPVASQAPAPEPPHAEPPVAEPNAEPAPAPGEVPDDWAGMVKAMGLGGLLAQLADNAVMESRTDDKVVLTLDQVFAQLHNKSREQELQDALRKLLGNPQLVLELTVGQSDKETPAATRKRETDERQQAAEVAIEEDPNIQALKDSFGAQIRPGSIRPRSNTSTD